jgi:hypothetical protein
MRRRTAVLFVLFALVALTGAALAGDKAEAVTVEGKLVCAKCTLGEESHGGCQPVVLRGEGTGAEKFYLVKNALAEEKGHVCKGQKSVKVTGNVTEKDGQKWLEATDITEIKS